MFVSSKTRLMVAGDSSSFMSTSPSLRFFAFGFSFGLGWGTCELKKPPLFSLSSRWRSRSGVSFVSSSFRRRGPYVPSAQYFPHFTDEPSISRVSITITWTFCSQQSL